MNHFSPGGDLRSETLPLAPLSASSLLANRPIGSPENQVKASDFGGSECDLSFFFNSREFPASRHHATDPTPPDQDIQNVLANVSGLIKPSSAKISALHSARNAQLAALWERIESFTRKPAGWAGEDSVPVSRETAQHAYDLLTNLPEHLRVPQATMSAEGEIGLTWFKGSDCLDALIAPDGYLSWATNIGDEFFEGEAIELARNTSFDRLYNALDTFYG